MKRYEHEYYGPGDDVGGNMNENEDGTRVSYAEATRIIDQLTAALKAAQTSHLCPCGEREARLFAADARAEALQARVAELERAVESSDAGRDSAFDLIEQKNNELDAAHEVLEIAESELADLRGRVARTEALLTTEGDGGRVPVTRLARFALEALRGR